jgi:hypothetical protein
MFRQNDFLDKAADKFSSIHDFGWKNLVTAGCSFTYNNSTEHVCSWPYYLKGLGGFKRVFDCSLPGAGNFHISHSSRWALLNSPELDPTDTLVVIMWSGNDRDDFICSADSLNDYPAVHNYDSGICTGITGGTYEKAIGNIDIDLLGIKSIKNKKTRAVENFLYIESLKTWLEQKGFTFVFLDYIDRSLPNLTLDFDIRPFLPDPMRKQLESMISKCRDPYSFCLKNDLIDVDDFHPTPTGYLTWTREILIPHLMSLNIKRFAPDTGM